MLESNCEIGCSGQMGCCGHCCGFLDCRESTRLHLRSWYFMRHETSAERSRWFALLLHYGKAAKEPWSMRWMWRSRYRHHTGDNMGIAADIQSIYSIATTPGLNPLFPALTISISNISPHLRNIGVQASTRLMQLFKAFSAPSFLLADEGHPRLVYYLLETINSILYHQFNGKSLSAFSLIPWL